MTDPMPYRCSAIEPGMGVLERCILNVGHGGGFHMAAGAWPVEGSTPLDSPARPCGMHYSWPSQAGSVAGTLGPCVLDVADHHERHRDEHGNEWLNVQWALDRLDAAPAGEVVSVPPPAPARADEPAPVPPPVDALLNLVDELHSAARDDDGYEIDRSRGNIVMAARDLWATGVEEGRREQAGKVEELQLLLDHAEQYARDLQDNGDVPGRAEILTEAYWKLREHASALRSTEVYRKASERKEGTLHESPAFQRYRWLEATARGIEDGARDLAEMLGVEEHEIERPEVPRG